MWLNNFSIKYDYSGKWILEYIQAYHFIFNILLKSATLKNGNLGVDSGWELALEEWAEKILSAGSWSHQDHIKEGGEKAGTLLTSF